jgi:hypothetical protein
MKRLGCIAILVFIISLFGGLAHAAVVLQDASYRSIDSGQAEIYFKFSTTPGY